MIRWFPRLNYSYDDGLLRNVTVNKDSLIVCRQGEKYRGFALFSPLYTFVNHIYSRNTHDRCFYEVIRGDSPQKPYFDIDISDSSITKTQANTLIDSLIDSILVDTRISRENILVFSSHGETKLSFHVVVDRWCLPDHNSNRIFCNKIIDRIKNPLVSFIDSLVYKSIQQFRTYGSTKYGKDRFKILESPYLWDPDDCDRSKFFNVILASLVSNTNSCRILEYTELVKKVFRTDLEDLTKDDIEIVENLDFIKDGTFSILDVRDRIILLKRNYPSYCQVCDREHQAENPYLIFGENSIFFHCRRTENDKVRIWTRPILEETPKERSKEDKSPGFNKTDFLKKFLGKR